MKARENFGSKFGAILAAAGSAVGLGNVWRFPIETGQNGGGAYIIIYILCIILLGYPVMMSEFIIGRKSRSSTAGAFKVLAPGTQWKWVGRLGVLTAFIILSYYAVVAGWTMEYIFLTLTDQFSGKSVADYGPMFNDFVESPWKSAMWTVVVFIVTMYVISRGVKDGIEKYAKILMPMLFILTLVLVGCAVNLPGASEGLEFLFNPDFSKINASVVMNALGQAFYSLSLGMGALITYASYFGTETRLRKTAVNVCAIDTFVALLAGCIVFPAMFNAGYSIKPDDIGPSLIFVTLPNVFQQSFSGMPILGYIFSVMFYLLLLVAAVTSMISLHEVVTAYLCEEWGMPRKKASVLVTTFAALLGVVCALSFGVLSDVRILDKTFFDLFDSVSSNYLLPVGGLLTTIFIGWYVDKKVIVDEVTNENKLRHASVRIIRVLIRYVAPIAITLIFLSQLGVI